MIELNRRKEIFWAEDLMRQRDKLLEERDKLLLALRMVANEFGNVRPYSTESYLPEHIYMYVLAIIEESEETI